MESSDDEGDGPSAFAKTAFLAAILLLSFYKLPQKNHALPLPVATAKADAPKQQKPVVAQSKKKKKKKIYLTFDDGPNKGTKNVLHIMQDEQVPVTFFVIGEHVFASRGQQKMWDSLQMAQHIDICNHSFTHAFNNHYNQFYQSPDSVVKDFSKCADSLHLNNNIVRTPGRNIWRIDSLSFTDLKKSTAAADSLQQAGYAVMGWDLEWHYDHKTMRVTDEAEKIVSRIDSLFSKNKTMTADHLVLLAHDQVYSKSDDSAQLRYFIKLLKQKDEYELGLATSYPANSIKKLHADTLQQKISTAQ